MDASQPWYYYQTFSKNQVNEILDDLLVQIGKLSKKKNLAKKTLQSYKEWLRPFLFMCTNLSHGLNNRECAQHYLELLKTKKRDYTYVVNVRLLLQKLFQFVPILPKIQSTELSDEIRTNEELYLTEKRVRAIRNWAGDHDSTNTPWLFDELADYITVILLTGVRPFEARNICILQCIQLRDKSSTLILGKGQKRRPIVCSNLPQTKRFFNALILRARRENLTNDSLPIFTRTDRFYRRAFLNLQKQILFFDCQKFCSLHSLRRAAARTLYASNRDTHLVKTFLGHTRQATTEKYLGVALDDLVDGVTESDLKIFN